MADSMTTGPCPHCGSDGYGPLDAVGTADVCPDCGYDAEHGTDPVCPGGKHPKDSRGDVCCDACWKRLPAKLPDPDGVARPWRRRRQQARRHWHRWGSGWADWFDHNNKTIREWLAANQKETR